MVRLACHFLTLPTSESTPEGDLPHAGGGLLVLLVVTVLNVYKPRGLTPYGWRKQHEERRTRHPQRVG